MNKEIIQKELLRIIEEAPHGKAVAKTNNCVKQGAVGVITAYLPEQNRFAIIWEGDTVLLTYEWTEEMFKKEFTIINKGANE